ncbi:glycogen synthase [Paenibacillus sp. SYP-B4298]|uniref:glycogen synthase n=1 Tax=Paenibacillus sp. SYP-B4298 TaxID=2996034 RepID=UPI0022DE565A|nr:glycogen synthase [Paenibacillus sp. SYP-B4298]
MKLLFAASEAAPLCSSGGLGEVLGSLPPALAKLAAGESCTSVGVAERNEGTISLDREVLTAARVDAGAARCDGTESVANVDVRVILPAHAVIPHELRTPLRTLAHGELEIAGECQPWRLLEGELAGLRCYLLDNAHYFGSGELYGYGDGVERYVFFCRAVVAALSQLDYAPDIVHVHDWQTALLPLLLRHAGHPARTVLTIHNMRYQGRLKQEELLRWLNRSEAAAVAGLLTRRGASAGLSCLELGLRCADKVTTVSPTYAQALSEEPEGAGLSSVVRELPGAIVGICNGIDTSAYDPLHDPVLAQPYSYAQGAAGGIGKAKCKLALQSRLGLSCEAERPLLAIVSRLAGQKGLDLVLTVLDRLVQRGCQLVVIGEGEPVYEQLLLQAAERYRHAVAVHIPFDRQLARQVYAGADGLLMPSQYEPCGISQLIGLRYASVPIVHLTGGLRDTITPYDRQTGRGNGFGFDTWHPAALLAAVDEALAVYSEPQLWQTLLTETAAQDWSWQQPAQQYMALYSELMPSIKRS